MALRMGRIFYGSALAGWRVLSKRARRTFSLLTKEQTRILNIAGLLFLPTLLTKVAGQAFYLIIASVYGTSGQISLFFVANALPEMLANILLLGVVGAVVIPLFVEARAKENNEDFLEFYSSVFNLALLAFSFVAILVIIFADQIMPFVLQTLIDPNQVPSTAELDEVIGMMRMLMIPQVLLGASVFISSGLHVYNRFLLPQLSPLFYRVGMLAGATALVPLLDGSPWALVYGVLIGAVAHLLTPLPLAWHVGLRIRPVINLDSKYMRKLFRVALPRLGAFASEQVAATVLTFVAFGYGKAFPASNRYAQALINTIPALFGLNFATAAYPAMARLFHAKKYTEYAELLRVTINQIVFLSVPFAVSAVILRLPTVRLVYGLLPGNFDRESTYMTAWLLLFLGLGIIFIATRGLIYRAFYAANNTRIPMIISFVVMIFTIGAAILFSNYFSHFDAYAIRNLYFDPSYFFTKMDGKAAVAGIGLASSLGALLEVGLLLIFLNRHVVEIQLRRLIADVLKIASAGAIMAVVMFGLYRLWEGVDSLPVDAEPGYQGSTTINLLVLTAITAGTAFMVYYLVCYLLQVEELRILRRFLNPIFKLGGLEIDK